MKDNCILVKEKAREVISPITNSSPVLHEVDSITDADVAEGNDDTQNDNIFVEIAGPIRDKYVDDEAKAITL